MLSTSLVSIIDSMGEKSDAHRGHQGLDFQDRYNLHMNSEV
jgi:hypothetical protein